MLQLLETSHAHLFVCCCHSGTRINRKVQWLLEGAKNVTSYSSSMLYESNLLPQRLSYEIFPSMHFCLLFHLINLFFLNVDYNILRQIDCIILNWTFFSILVLLYCCRLVLFVSTVILGFNKPWRSIQNSKKRCRACQIKAQKWQCKCNTSLCIYRFLIDENLKSDDVFGVNIAI